MRLGVDQIADRRLLLHPLAPAHRIDRLLRRIDHHIAVDGLDKARIAAGEIDFGERVRSDPAHRCLRYPRSSAIFPDQPKRHKSRPEAPKVGAFVTSYFREKRGRVSTMSNHGASKSTKM